MSYLGKYQYQLAEIGHLHEIKDLFNRVTDHLLLNGIDQWDGRYPALNDILCDIDAACCWVYLDEDQIVRATMTLNNVEDEQYQNIKWKFSSPNIAVLHRVAVDPVYQGQGLGKDICSFAEFKAIEKGDSVIRLDTYSGNVASNGLYKSLGYVRAKGLCFFHGNKVPFYCYEKAFSL